VNTYEKFQSAPHFGSEANALHSRAIQPVGGFNPRLTSAARRTNWPRSELLPGYVSIRASLRQRGELHSAGGGRRSDNRFNPRLTSAARRTTDFTVTSCATIVSIRASLRQRGERARGPPSSGGPAAFQSAPHFGSEANLPNLIGLNQKESFNPRLTSAARRTSLPFQRCRKYAFQSAPHFGSEANRSRRASPDSFWRVSIRASLRQRGEQQPRADRRPMRDRFNPRLTSAARRTPRRTPVNSDNDAFQSAPHFGSEANSMNIPVSQ